LRGESEPLRRYGVLLNDAVLKQEAMTLGIYDGKGALTAQQKVLAALAAIYKQTSDAQGDFMRTSDGLANSQRTLSAMFEDVKVKMGQAFIKDIETATQNAIFLTEQFEKLPEPAQKSAGELKKVGDVANVIRNPLSQLWWLLTKTRETLDAQATGAFNEDLRRSAQQTMRMADAAGILKKGLVDVEPAAGGAAKKVESFAEALKDKLGEALDDAKDALDDAKKEFDNFGTTVSDSIKSAFSFADAQTAGAEAGAGFLDGLRSQVKGVTDYAAKIQALLDSNLSQDALAQVLASGMEAGMAIADQLIAGGQAAIDETNALVDSANAAAAKVGLNAAAKWYQAGIDSATGIVNGLQAELDKLTPKLMAKMDAIASKMKRTVSIDVLVNERVNKIVASVGGIPKMADGGIVNKPTLALIGEAGPEAVVPLSKMNAGGGGDVNINVTGGLATSAEIGQAITNALRAYSRSAGPLALNIA
jgi:hypothetical protein